MNYKKVINVVYYIVRFSWYFLITLIATTLWKSFGFWFLILCAVTLLFGDLLIKKIFKI